MNLKLATVKNYLIQLPSEPHTFEWCVGFDPGTVNMGLAILLPHLMTANVYEITVQRGDDAIQRMKNLHYILSDMYLILSTPLRLCIEGAAYSKSSYRQVELAEIRAAAFFWFDHYGAKTKIVPPNKIRKGVFGDGKKAAQDVWEGLPADALAALSCAYYAANCWEK